MEPPLLGWAEYRKPEGAMDGLWRGPETYPLPSAPLSRSSWINLAPADPRGAPRGLQGGSTLSSYRPPRVHGQEDEEMQMNLGPPPTVSHDRYPRNPHTMMDRHDPT